MLCAAHRRGRMLVQIAKALLGPGPNRRPNMFELGLAFALGERDDTIRETTRRFAADKNQPLAAHIGEEDRFHRELWPDMGAPGLPGLTRAAEDGGFGICFLAYFFARPE